MKKIFISPHLDDAICSCAGLINNYIKENHDVYVVTVFSNQVTPSELSEFAKELHSEWAENGSFDRVKENDEACRELKVKSINLNFDDAIYRKHLDKFLYPINDGSIFDKPSKYDAFLPYNIAFAIAQKFEFFGSEFFFPIAKGNHVDHAIVRQAGEILQKQGYKVSFYEEIYYDGNLNINNLKNSKFYLNQEEINQKISAILKYKSQLKMLFNGTDRQDLIEYFLENNYEKGKFFESYFSPIVSQKNYIGINYDGKHDSCVAYFTNKIEFIGQEERFSRKKKDGRKPLHALEYLFKNYNIDLNNTEFVFPILNRNESIEYWKNSEMLDIYETVKDDMSNGLNFAHALTDSPKFVRHHDAHAASAYFTSGFKGKVLICTIDGGNDYDPYSTNLYVGENGKIKPLLCLPDISIASDYLLVTAALGFKPLEGEGKVTGLSSFGCYNQSLNNELLSILNDKSLIHKATKWGNVGDEKKCPTIEITDEIKVFDKILGKYTKEDIAFAIQYITESRVKNLLKPYLKKYKKIVCAGGLFANVKLNSYIKDLGFKQIYIHPGMGDEGLALGAILYHKSLIKPLKPLKFKNIYFGQDCKFGNKDLERLFVKENLKFVYFEKGLENKIAELLFDNKIIAICRGRMEYGPRALGDRSILVNANNNNINKILNNKLNRTEFMPFAPVVYDKQASILFKDLKGVNYTCKFMTITRKCTQLMEKIAPAAVHIDGTARPQIVDKKANEFYYNILKCYAEKTNNSSVLINTSFNLHGEPIVSTPQEAIKSFKNANLDFLVVNNYLVYSKNRSEI